MNATETPVDQPAKSRVPESAPAEKTAAVPSDLAVDEFFTQLQSDMRRPDLSQDAIAAAFQAIQKLALDSGPEEAAQTAAVKAVPAGANTCHSCNAANSAASRFCSACGLPLQRPKEEAGVVQVLPRNLLASITITTTTIITTFRLPLPMEQLRRRFPISVQPLVLLQPATCSIRAFRLGHFPQPG